MDRLTERFSNGQVAALGCGNNCKYDFKYCKTYNENCPTMTQIYEKLARYEDMEEYGKMLKLPCKIGDTVYELCKCDDGIYRICPMIVKSLSHYGQARKDKNGCIQAWNIYAESDYTYMYKSFYDFGKTVFLTEQEAKEALWRMKNE